MLNIRYRPKVSVPSSNEDLGGMYERVFKRIWNEDDHPRGQPNNAGQFVEAGGASGEKPLYPRDRGVRRNASTSSGTTAQDHFAKVDDLGTLTTAQIEMRESRIVDRKLKPNERAVYDEHNAELLRELKAHHQTFEVHAGDTEGYTAERFEKQQVIFDKLMEKALVNAKPADGQDPVFTILAGRGGSGKSKFSLEKKLASGVYDPSKNLVIDADAIKLMLMDMDGKTGKGHLAYLYHEESTHIAERLLSKARDLGLNVVYDATMKSDKPQIIDSFKNEGYSIEAHLMDLPREMAANRALDRYLRGNNPKTGATGRLVKPSVVLENQNNEKNFDLATSRGVDKWSIWDNRVEGENESPVLVARSSDANLRLRGRKSD